MAWWCTGVRWREAGPALGWWAPGRAGRESVLAYGQELAFVVRGGRGCLGVWRGGRRTPCPRGAEVPARATRAQCEECARIDRSYSVAADTMADDPRPYAVYLAYFGPGLVKVGITADERGSARLLEQGAVAFTWLARGPLMAARRVEELVGVALGVPDRIPYAKKRLVRSALPPFDERVAELRECRERAGRLTGWPESLERAPFEVVDHSGRFGLTGEGAATAVVRELAAEAVVVGRLTGVAGPDLHLAAEGGEVLVLDGRLLAGWRLDTAPAGAVADVRTVELGGVQGGLF
ncbi:DUF2797 domain-containing protein [Streptomyces indicus]|uniref:DUF2797 domain-containing protein n=1 Tax=Streptomyces indicus TaxID=417292 RepID=A0A1G9ERT6_9ACTN|nr:DUF2797 domain-containing protein [Streptomyces indicus]SDK78849.1 Protein of unknown function [Streptomyces indicus]